MCLIIDTNCLANVFDTEAKDHQEFRPVKEWITNGKGKMIVGGTKYFEELRRTPTYLKLVAELAKSRKIVRMEDSTIDRDAMVVSKQIQDPDFDDQHIVALLRCSGCQVVCSLDKRAYPYFQHLLLFEAGKRPKIYTGKRNKSLLTDKYTADICKQK